MILKHIFIMLLTMEVSNRRLYWGVVLGIFLISVFFRFWLLQVVPPSPSLDEVSIGYNAYSLLHTGRDEYGNVFPLLLRAYDDWRPILYVYLTVPLVAFFGLNVFSVRLLSVVLSVATVCLCFLLVPLLFKKGITAFGVKIQPSLLGLTSALLLSISPWHIYLSRLGHEVNLGLFLTVVSVYLFLRGILYKKVYSFLLSSVAFGFSFYTYQSQKVIIPILLLTLVLLYFRELKKNAKQSICALGLFMLIAFPAVIVSFTPEGMTRFSGTSVLSVDHPLYKDSAEKIVQYKKENNLFGELYYNRRFVPVRLIASQYISHFNPHWLFSGGARENHKVPFMGLLYLFEAPFLLFGSLVFLCAKIERRVKFFLLIWFLSSPLPASITTEAPHAMRSFTFLPTLQILVSFGIIFPFSFLRNLLVRYVAIATLLIIVIFSLRGLITNYFFVFPRTQADSFQSALFDSMDYVKENKKNYDAVIISNEKNLYQSYMFYLFSSGYDPKRYLVSGGTESGGFVEEHEIENISFRTIDWNTEKKQGRMMYVGNKEDFPKVSGREYVYLYPDGKPGVYIVTYD